MTHWQRDSTVGADAASTVKTWSDCKGKWLLNEVVAEYMKVDHDALMVVVAVAMNGHRGNIQQSAPT